MSLRILIWAFLLGIAVEAQVPAAVSMDPDYPGRSGHYGVTEYTYQLPAQIDPLVMADRMTELWAQVYWPQDAPGPKPIVVALHGNRATCEQIGGRREGDLQSFSCEYTYSGSCPEGSRIVASHLGFDYIARQLASWGYGVFAINANRGINCGGALPHDWGLNLARGHLILRHLQQLSDWHRHGGSVQAMKLDLQGQLDFGQIGLLGHSRGGEAVRIAYEEYWSSQTAWVDQIGDRLGFRALLEIAPVDGQSNRLFNANNVPWLALLAACDGDVSDLQGVGPYDRMISNSRPSLNLFNPRSMVYIWGANHNHFNSQWLEDDSPGCAFHKPLPQDQSGSLIQRTVTQALASAFFLAHLGNQAQSVMATHLDPAWPLPDSIRLLTPIQRSQSEGNRSELSWSIDRFEGDSDDIAHSVKYKTSGIDFALGMAPFPHRTRHVGRVQWHEGGDDGFLQIAMTESSDGQDLTEFATLEFDLARNRPLTNDVVPTDFSIRLLLSDGTMTSPVYLSTYSRILGPVGPTSYESHRLLTTIRIPLDDFGLLRRSQVRAIRFSFDQSPSGDIYLSQLGLLKRHFATHSEQVEGVTGDSGEVIIEKSHVPLNTTLTGTMRGLRPGPLAPCEVGINLNGTFVPTDALPVLVIGPKRFRQMRRPVGGRLDRVYFRVPCHEYWRELGSSPEVYLTHDGRDDRIDINIEDR